MAIAVVTQVIAASQKGWDDAARKGFERASQTLRNITGMEVISQKAKVVNGEIREYRVTLKITFILEESKGK